MKKCLFPVLALFLLTAFAPATKMTPQEYNDVIIGEQNKISKIMIDMANYFGTDINKSEQLRGELVTQCKNSVSVLRTLPAYDGSSKFRDAGIDLYNFYAEISSKEYKEMIDILKKTDIQASDIERLTSLEKDITQREIPLDDAFQKAQTEFANKYGFKLIENEYQEQIDQMGK